MKTWELPRWNLKLVPTYERWGETKQADYPRFVGSRFNQQVDLHIRLVLGGRKRRTLHPPARIFKVYAEALTEFSHIYTVLMVSTIPYSPRWPLEYLLLWEWRAEHNIPRTTSRGWGASHCLRPARKATSGHISSKTSFNRFYIGIKYVIAKNTLQWLPLLRHPHK